MELEKYKQKWDMTEGLINPYPAHSSQLQTLSSLVDPQDLVIIRSVRPDKGVQQHIVRMFIYAVAREIEDKGLTYQDEKEFYDIIRRRTAIESS